MKRDPRHLRRGAQWRNRVQSSTGESDEPFHFGHVEYESVEQKLFWEMHEPVVRAWITEMRARGDPWWQSAQHAADCLVSHREFEGEQTGELHWREFDVDNFLFHDLHEGGTVGFFGSVPIFFDQLVEAFERFLAAGIIDKELGTPWLGQLRASRARFLNYYRIDDE